MNTSESLNKAYHDLLPYSKKYTVDFDRYLFSLELLQKLPNFKSKKILDIGTGIGLMPLALHNLGAQVSGLDYYVFPESENQMFQIKEISDLQKIWKENTVTVYNNNIYFSELPPEIQSVDIIISECMIEHLKDPKKFLTRAHDLLTTDGILLVTTPNLATLLKRLRFLIGRSPHWPVEEFFADGENFTGHWREYTMKELIFLCEKSGFEIIETHNKNLLTKFKGWKNWRKNIRALVMSLSWFVPQGREMHYVLCRKK